ncbi:MAG: aspartate kinase [Elusimicrobia bacterium CG_4_10_14_3_um_filter_49_12_50_7]|nr:MAG: aspartate kinase [Elusimicrobia bacterium CG03_land_8_20_14_0_80_50_18]PIX15045.1 MAG: aspartate kinase [Elusimicrobia bacterium CG_4_8_14_3_um_filter_50_9]PIY15473.1 MAG: aspartate kinase [Elusimicrobia bacterium CG_4_10_14_3_um_filter_49_12_50_7]
MKKNEVIVLKFGGSSVANPGKIKYVAKRVKAFVDLGYKPVVIVSAPGDTTDDLIKEAAGISANPHAREMDMLLATGEQKTIALLAMALWEMGQKVVSFTGAQMEIITDGNYGVARIKSVSSVKLVEALKKGYVAVVAGFQGISIKGEITTLGRGGSDLTAIAIASVLNARCKIFTDVEGIFTANPKVYAKAKKIDIISYDEMLEMASAGAGVMQARAVELAKNKNVPFEVACTFSRKRGTVVCGEDKLLEKLVVRSVTEDRNQAKINVSGVPDRPGIAADIFEALSDKNICVDMIIQSSAKSSPGSPVAVNDISFTVKRSELASARKILESVRKKMQIMDIMIKENIAKVSIVGSGMKTHSGVASRLFRVLAKNKINIEMISTSEIKISCVIDGKNTARAVKAIAGEFKL